MTPSAGDGIRVLAVAPSTAGVGFAVFEGPGLLVDWGVKEAKREKNTRSLLHVACLVDRYRPDTLVAEDCRGKLTRRGPRVRNLIREIVMLASERGVRTVRFSRVGVQKAFAPFAATKHQIASVVAQQFPELAPQLPPPRKVWKSEDRRMGMFDAAALALTFFRSGNY